MHMDDCIVKTTRTDWLACRSTSNGIYIAATPSYENHRNTNEFWRTSTVNALSCEKVEEVALPAQTVRKRGLAKGRRIANPLSELRFQDWLHDKTYPLTSSLGLENECN